jgi:hypothetical protein
MKILFTRYNDMIITILNKFYLNFLEIFQKIKVLNLNSFRIILISPFIKSLVDAS